MTFWIEPLTDTTGTKHWILFEHGQFHNPTAVITDAEMKSIAAAVLGTRATIDDLAHDLKMYRKANRYAQKEMAALIGISRNYLSQIERGEANNLSVAVVDRIRRELGQGGEVQFRQAADEENCQHTWLEDLNMDGELVIADHICKHCGMLGMLDDGDPFESVYTVHYECEQCRRLFASGLHHLECPHCGHGNIPF